jgi:dihydropteroate synthase
MGILNCTPDSFFDGRQASVSDRVQQAMIMIDEGADWIDIGGESTRPGSQSVSEQEELDRVIPVIEKIREETKHPISIDTSKSEVAKVAIQAGANMINDVSAGRDPLMKMVAAECDCEVVLMHMQGSPESMQNSPHYEDVQSEVKGELGEKVKEWTIAGVKPERIILDPGIGFGKRLEDNLGLLRDIGELGGSQRVLLGASRKSFICGLDDKATSPDDRLPGSLAAIVPAYTSGVHMLRVHDVAATRQFLLVLKNILPLST